MDFRSGVAFGAEETGSLRAVLLLALAALDHTHHVSEDLMRQLSEAVFEAYIDLRCPPLPLSPVEMEELAVLSIEFLTHSVPEMLVLKH